MNETNAADAEWLRHAFARETICAMRAESEITRLRLTDAEREAIERSIETLDGVEDLHPTTCEADAAAVATLRKLLERLK